MLTHRDRESSDGVVCKDLLVSYGHLERPKLLLSTLWPILLTLDAVALLHIGYHDNRRGMLLPNQTPEIYNSLR